MEVRRSNTHSPVAILLAFVLVGAMIGGIAQTNQFADPATSALDSGDGVADLNYLLATYDIGNDEARLIVDAYNARNCLIVAAATTGYAAPAVCAAASVG